MGAFLFLLLFLVLDVGINLLTKNTVKFLGFDFLFFASWLAGVKYGLWPAILISLLLLAEHTIFFLGKGRFILLSFPAQLIAVLMGHYLGVGYFTISLVAYQVANLSLMMLVNAFGPGFVLFLAFNTIFNLILFRVYSLFSG
ncbi:hypothetical protein A3K63_02085 [Candidatus Micrarchaeota archaeon RBG_16_49_10]|nr:MAG: hypothetical protein A3K63_02085 [Candidatus Micrarchaeota archaeon RBG_16_49_10]